MGRLSMRFISRKLDIAAHNYSCMKCTKLPGSARYGSLFIPTYVCPTEYAKYYREYIDNYYKNKSIIYRLCYNIYKLIWGIKSYE